MLQFIANIVEPAEQNLSKVPQLFAQLGEHLIDSDFKRPDLTIHHDNQS
ncbi:MAG: hypothetical protein IJ780_00235 [Neisseriaceae bacterium]|nr:hypothetical protein [Neisseriaceae bacterium]MBR1818546.1 hypothetical protein [Neisseriaceae bacterium]